MRQIVRWLLGLLLLLKEEWGKAKIDRLMRQGMHEIQALCDREHDTFRAFLVSVHRLEKEAARSLAQHPAAGEIIVAMLRKRMQQLASDIGETAAQRKRPTV